MHTIPRFLPVYMSTREKTKFSDEEIIEIENEIITTLDVRTISHDSYSFLCLIVITSLTLRWQSPK